MSRPTEVPVSTAFTQRDRGQRRALEQVDELHEVRELAGETIQRRDVHDLHLALAYEREQRVERRPTLRAPAHAVVRERMRDAAAVDLSLSRMRLSCRDRLFVSVVSSTDTRA